MVYPRFLGIPVFSETLVPAVVVHDKTCPVPVVAFDTEMIVRVYRQLGFAATGLQYPLRQLDTGRYSRAIHFLNGDGFVFFDECFSTVVRCTAYVDTYKSKK